jgi:hypothetical protein
MLKNASEVTSVPKNILFPENSEICAKKVSWSAKYAWLTVL